MTDEQIIKALECCIKETSDCDNCPLYIPADADCINISKSGALALINRLQEENERLKASRDKWKEIATIFDQAIRDKDATIEMLEEMVGEDDAC